MTWNKGCNRLSKTEYRCAEGELGEARLRGRSEMPLTPKNLIWIIPA